MRSLVLAWGSKSDVMDVMVAFRLGGAVASQQAWILLPEREAIQF